MINSTKNLLVISDFDRTLTKKYIDDKKASICSTIVEDSQILGDSYSADADKIRNKYRKIMTTTQTEYQREQVFSEWWRDQANLLIKYNATKETLRDATASNGLVLTPGTKELLTWLNINSVPLVIMSGGIEEIIENVLKINNVFTDNISIEANRFKFDKSGKIIDYYEPVKNVINKHKHIKDSIRRIIESKSTYILIGDLPEDTYCSQILSGQVIRKFGLLHGHEATLEMTQSYDYLIPNCDLFPVLNYITDKFSDI
jgi:cytosolic 5'-nucleotidase 3